MHYVSLLALLLAVPACAQTQQGEPGQDSSRRADTMVVQPGAPEMSTPDPRVAEEISETTSLLLGNLTVTLATHRAPGAEGQVTVNALNLHDDESTSVDAARTVIAELGGRVVEIQHSGDRNLTFTLGGRVFKADPNRIFTDAGRRKTLAALSTDAPAARSALSTFADSVLAHYTSERPSVVVTLHNNTENNYGTRDYLRGGQYFNEAAATTLQDGADPDDFFFVTDRPIYDALVAKGFNVVLQDNDAATDDGSLSVWAAQNGVPYVNVEAQHGHAEEQARMLRALAQILND